MRKDRGLLLLGLLLIPARAVTAQGHQHDHSSPYAAFTDRDIKALSAEETAGLRNGDGLEMALAAELNGYPGPKHALELKTVLGLSAEQESRISEILQEMRADARTIGTTIIDLERRLDRAFAAGTITERQLAELLDAIGRHRAQLRMAHLRAHVRLLPVLTEAQRQAYARARGYGG